MMNHSPDWTITIIIMEINEILVTESGDDTTGDDNVTKQEAGVAEINKLNLQAPTVDSQNRSR